MNPVPASSDPERRPAASAPGRPSAVVAPPGSIGTLDDVRPGALLVAMPMLTDPTFAGTVVYVLDHSATGTVGVVLNRPSEVAIHDVLPGWSDLAVEPGVFHVGGPCESETALCLAVATGRPGAALQTVDGDVHLVDLDSDPDELGHGIAGLRVFAGYAGWSPGQLGAEIAEGAWACLAGQPDDVVSTVGGAALWRSVLGRQTGRRAVLSTATADPSQN